MEKNEIDYNRLIAAAYVESFLLAKGMPPDIAAEIMTSIFRRLDNHRFSDQELNLLTHGLQKCVHILDRMGFKDKQDDYSHN